MKIASVSKVVCALSVLLEAWNVHAQEDEMIPIEDWIPLEDLPPVVLDEVPPLPCPDCPTVQELAAEGHRVLSYNNNNNNNNNKKKNAIRHLAGTSYIVDFEGLADVELIEDIYLDSIGMEFEQFAHSIIDKDAGGSGWFAEEPTPSTAMFFPLGSTAQHSSASFAQGLSSLTFSYSSGTFLSQVVAFLGPAGTGATSMVIPRPLMKNHNLNNCDGDPDGYFCNWDTTTIIAPPGFEIFRIFISGQIITVPQWGGQSGSAICHLFIDNFILTLPGNPPAGGGGGPDDPIPVRPPGAGGDPHFLRWQQQTRDSFHGECDLVMVKNEDFNNGQGLDVHLRTTISDWYSYIEAAAVRIGQSVVEFHLDSFIVGGTKHSYNELPFIIDQGDQEYEIVQNKVVLSNGKTRQVVQLHLSDESYLEVRFTAQFLNVNVNGSESDFGKSMGLLGDFATGDMIGRTGRVFDNYVEFGYEWQVTPEDHQVFSHVREPQLPFEQCRMPTAAVAASRRLRAQNRKLYEAAVEACEGSSDFDLCVTDVATTGELELADAFF